MLQVTREIITDVTVRSTGKAVIAKQHDTGSRFLNVHIQESGKPVNITSPATVLFNVLRPDGTSGEFYGSVNEDGTVRVVLTSWMLGQPGIVSCDISIVSESAKLTTMTFYIEVEAAVRCDEDIEETDEYNVIVDLLAQTQEAYDMAAAAATQATYVVETCAGAAESAHAAAQRADDAAKHAANLYVGSGEMPEGCNVQIDPDGAVLEMDTELNVDSLNPVANRAVARKFEEESAKVEKEFEMVGSKFEEVEERFNGVDNTLNNQTEMFAPSGYGLGKVWPEKKVYTPADLDTLKETGWYFADFIDYNNAPGTKVDLGGIRFNYATVHVVAIDQDTFYQIVYPHPSNCHSTIWRYHTGTRGFYAWEVEYPPMEAGKEYRTTERFNGSSVYVQRVSISALPNNDYKYVALCNDSVSRIVSINTMLYSPLGKWYQIGSITPYTNLSKGKSGTIEVFATHGLSGGELGVYTNFDVSDHSAEIVVKYTK